MSQMYTTWLAEKIDPDMLALEMPFIFEDHDHATRVLEGEVGETLLDKITEKSNVRGMAFTYSGGFRNVITNKKISTLQGLVDEDQN
jgi:TRAP-type C4-dicarboxylate transport system substrate-binding protein